MWGSEATATAVAIMINRGMRRHGAESYGSAAASPSSRTPAGFEYIVARHEMRRRRETRNDRYAVVACIIRTHKGFEWWVRCCSPEVSPPGRLNLRLIIIQPFRVAGTALHITAADRSSPVSTSETCRHCVGGTVPPR